MEEDYNLLLKQGRQIEELRKVRDALSEKNERLVVENGNLSLLNEKIRLEWAALLREIEGPPVNKDGKYKELEAKYGELLLESERVRSQVLELDAKLGDELVQKEELISKNQILVSDKEDLLLKNRELLLESERMRSQVRELDAKLGDELVQKEELISKNQILVSDKEDLLLKNRELLLESERVRSQVGEVDAKYGKEILQMKELVSKLRAEKKDLCQKVEELVMQKKELDLERECFSADNTKLSSQIEELQLQIDNLTERNKQLSSTNKQIHSRVEKLVRKNNQLSSNENPFRLKYAELLAEEKLLWSKREKDEKVQLFLEHQQVQTKHDELLCKFDVLLEIIENMNDGEEFKNKEQLLKEIDDKMAKKHGT